MFNFVVLSTGTGLKAMTVGDFVYLIYSCGESNCGIVIDDIKHSVSSQAY